MKTLLGNTIPNYVKITAVGLLAVTYLAALIVGVDEYIVQGPNATIPSGISLIIGTGLGVALNLLGIHVGAAIVNASTQEVMHNAGS